MPNPRCPLRGVPHVARQALPPLSPIHVPTSLPCAPLPCPEPCRDTNASGNVDRVFLQHVKDGTRPGYLQRPRPGSAGKASSGAGAGRTAAAVGTGISDPGAHGTGDGPGPWVARGPWAAGVGGGGWVAATCRPHDPTACMTRDVHPQPPPPGSPPGPGAASPADRPAQAAPAGVTPVPKAAKQAAKQPGRPPRT